jgi:hypothetical protein
VSFILAALAYQRFMDRRWRMTELCYATAVIVGACGTVRPAEEAELA